MAESPGPIVIVGGGHAAAQLCAGLAGAGLGTQTTLVCAEAELPYQRPPLSKAFLRSADEALQWHRPQGWYAEAGITLHRADPALAIDRGRRALRLRSGRVVDYARLVLATGARPRRLPQLPAAWVNVVALRSAGDAVRLREQIAAARHLTVLGGGFIGLEIAATAHALGKRVTVIEAAPRLLMRSVSAGLAEHVLQVHRASGIELRLGAQAGGFEPAGDRLAALEVDGRREPVELLVLGIGAEPECSLASDAGLHCDNGIVVDDCLRSSDPAILAIGDCANFPAADGGARLRLESVQNANDQARTALATLLDQAAPHRTVPWFWSDQGSVRLQMAGLLPADGAPHRRPGAVLSSFSILHYRGDRLVCVESVNAPLDHVMSRKLLEADRHPVPAQACDPATPLKTWL